MKFFLHRLRALEECFDFSSIFRNCRSELDCSEQSLKMVRAANSQDFIASSVVFLKSQFLESCDYVRTSVFV